MIANQKSSIDCTNSTKSLGFDRFLDVGVRLEPVGLDDSLSGVRTREHDDRDIVQLRFVFQFREDIDSALSG